MEHSILIFTTISYIALSY